MTEVSNLSFKTVNQFQPKTTLPKQEQTVPEQSKPIDNKQSDNKSQLDKTKKDVVYVSKNPDAVVNASGVVAGTAGMVGGAVLGGVVGACKLPASITSAVATTNYGEVLTNSLNGFKAAIKSSPELTGLADALKNIRSPQASEELINITKTLSTRLEQAFINDPEAMSVINKTIDPIINSLTLKKNLRNVGSGLRTRVKSPIGQAILKLVGFNKKTSTIVGSAVGNIASGFTTAAENIAHFTPEEKAAWGRVAKEIKNEFMTNPKLKTSSAVGKAIGSMFKDFSWLTEPLKNMQGTVLDTVKGLNKKLGYAPIKSIGKWSAIGAVACGTLSTLGWFGLKKGLMTKENEKAVKAGQI